MTGSKSKAGHRSDEITSYLSDTLEPPERAAFEAHLAGCEECRRDLEAQQALFLRVNEALAVKPKRTIEEQVARFEKIVAAERAAQSESRNSAVPKLRRRRLPNWALGLAARGFAAAAAAAGIWELAAPRVEQVVVGVVLPDAGRRDVVAAQRPADAGLDGGARGGEGDRR